MNKRATTLKELVDLYDSYEGKEDEDSKYYRVFYRYEIVYKLIEMGEEEPKFRDFLDPRIDMVRDYIATL